MENVETKIVLIRLTSGEEILDELPTKCSGDIIELNNPILVLPQPTHTGELKISLINYGHNYVKKFKLIPEHIVWIGTPDENLKSKYKQATSPIALPEEKVIELHPNT